MENSRIAGQLVKLITHLRPDLAKVARAYVRAIEETDSFAGAAQKVHAAARTNKQREALRSAGNLLTTLSELAEFRNELTELAQLAADPPFRDQPTTRAPSTSSRQAPVVVAEVADRLAAELFGARNDRDRFSQLHRQLADAKRVNTPTLHRVAAIFLDTSQKFSGRKQALDAILRRHHDELRVAEQDRMLNRLE